MPIGIRLTGDWVRAGEILANGALRMRSAMHKALKEEAHFFRAQVVKGIRDQAPGGKAFKPLSPLTIATRKLTGFGGTKALIRTASLIRSVTVKIVGDEAFVGVLRTARNKQGKSLMNIAAVHEFGSRTIVINVTPKMRAFLAAVFAKTRGLRSTTGGSSGTTTPPNAAANIIVVKIPARPFLRPVFAKYAGNLESQRRFLQRVARAFSGEPAAALFQW